MKGYYKIAATARQSELLFFQGSVFQSCCVLAPSSSAVFVNFILLNKKETRPFFLKKKRIMKWEAPILIVFL